MDKAKNIDNINPFLAFEKGFLVTKMGAISAGYKLTLPELFTLTEGEYVGLHNIWTKAIKVLPANTIVHKQDWFIKENYKPQYKPDEYGSVSFHDKAFQRHFIERPFLNHTCYLFITQSTKQELQQKSTLSTLCKKRIVPREMLDENVINNFIEGIAQLEAIIRESGYIKLERLTETDFLGNEKEFGLIDKYLSLSTEGITLSDIQFNSDNIKAGDKTACIFAINEPEKLPLQVSVDKRYDPLSTDKSSCFLSFCSPVGLFLHHNHIYNQYIFIEDQSQVLKDLESRAKRLKSFSSFSRQNMINYEFINAYLDGAHRNGYRCLHSHFNVLAWGEESEYQRVKSDTASAITQMECTPHQDTLGAPILYWAGIPGNAGDFPAEDKFSTYLEVAACMFYNETNYQESLSPFGIKVVDRFTGKPLHIDISDEPYKNGIINNFNKFILGPSGSGKSFVVNHILRQYYEQGAHITIVDVGNSYLNTCNYITYKTRGKDGVYFTYTEEKPISFNPFYTDNKVFSVEKKQSLSTLIFTLWKKENEEPTMAEEVGISDSINLFVKKIQTEDIIPNFNSYYEFLKTEYRENSTAREKEFDLDNLIYVLKPFYKGGEYDYLLNSDKQIDLLNKRFVVFELDTIKDHPVLFPVVTIIIMESFINKMRNLDGIRKVMLIEEAWKAIAKAGMAEFLKYLFKTIRKHFGEAMVVTQEADDILDSPIVKDSIINNSDCKILLDQRKYMNKFDAIQAVLGLTDKQKSQVLSINRNNDPNLKYKEAYIDLGGAHSAVYAIEVSPEEYYTYTTDQREKLTVLQLTKERGGNLEVALRELAEDVRYKKQLT
jgi:conjugation system TraG family ATPase